LMAAITARFRLGLPGKRLVDERAVQSVNRDRRLRGKGGGGKKEGASDALGRWLRGFA